MKMSAFIYDCYLAIFADSPGIQIISLSDVFISPLEDMFVPPTFNDGPFLMP